MCNGFIIALCEKCHKHGTLTLSALGGHIKCGAKSRAYLPVLLLRKMDTMTVTHMLRKMDALAIKVILTCPLS